MNDDQNFVEVHAIHSMTSMGSLDPECLHLLHVYSVYKIDGSYAGIVVSTLYPGDTIEACWSNDSYESVLCCYSRNGYYIENIVNFDEPYASIAARIFKVAIGQ